MCVNKTPWTPVSDSACSNLIMSTAPGSLLLEIWTQNPSDQRTQAISFTCWELTQSINRGDSITVTKIFYSVLIYWWFWSIAHWMARASGLFDLEIICVNLGNGLSGFGRTNPWSIQSWIDVRLICLLYYSRSISYEPFLCEILKLTC